MMKHSAVFADGEDQLLIAADIAQVGLNLQHARKLIFFSNPWSPVAVEQWIGRSIDWEAPLSAICWESEQ